MLNYKNLNLRLQAEFYSMAEGEQSVLIVEPYKSEILPFWKFKMPADAKKSTAAIKKLFKAFKKQDDIAGAILRGELFT